MIQHEHTIGPLSTIATTEHHHEDDGDDGKASKQAERLGMTVAVETFAGCGCDWDDVFGQCQFLQSKSS